MVVPLPLPLAEAVERLCSHSVTPASDFMASSVLAGVTNFNDSWSAPDSLALPFSRVLPLLGRPLAEDAIAALNVRSSWQRLQIPTTATLMEPDVAAAILGMVKGLMACQESTACHAAVEGARILLGDLDATEKRWIRDSSGGPATTRRLSREGGEDDPVALMEGEAEGPLPNEYR